MESRMNGSSMSTYDNDGSIRRKFLIGAGMTGVTAATSFMSHAEKTETVSERSEESSDADSVSIKLRINGSTRDLEIDARASLLDTLRESAHLTGTKKGCDHGQCGACTVHVNGRRINSCLTLAIMHEDDEITTIEGLGVPDNLHPMQAAFLHSDGYQCGYCTSGQIMSAVALMREPCGPLDEDVKELMSGNICRCGAYMNIVAAIQHVRRGN